MAKKLYNLATEEWTKELLNKLRNARYYDLKTSDKTVIGAINELAELLELCLRPTYDISAKMYYGVLDPEIVGSIKDYKDINEEIMDNSELVTTRPGTRTSVKVNNIKQGQYILVAIPAMYLCDVQKDDGFGEKVPFNDTVVGANGIDVDLFGEDYRLFGEMALIDGDMTIYIDVVIEDDGCDCPEVTMEDIYNIIEDLDNPVDDDLL